MDYQKRIKELMQQKGITNIWEFARNIDIPGPTLDGILNRTQRANGPRIDTLIKICTGLGVTLSEFMGETAPTEDIILSRYNLTRDEISFIAANLKTPGFIEALNILQTLPNEAREILLQACLIHKDRLKD